MDEKEKKKRLVKDMNIVKNNFINKYGFRIDFRRHCYVENKREFAPVFSKKIARNIINELFNYNLTDHEKSLKTDPELVDIGVSVLEFIDLKTYMESFIVSTWSDINGTNK